MRKKLILVVEDDEDIRALLRHTLTKERYNVIEAALGREALAEANAKRPDAVILDIMLPDIDGLEVCRRLKTDPAMKHIPVVMLTAKSEDTDIVVGLELGAEDYITKPFSPRVLVARLKNVLRQRAVVAEKAGEEIVVEKLVIRPGKHEVVLKGTPLDLTATEFEVLQFLAARRGWVFTRHQIVEAVRGDEYVVTDRAVDVQIAGLRKKLGEYGRYIETVRGVGYRFKE
jgi:two-component system phosphate regulon response regulator PhoB